MTPTRLYVKDGVEPEYAARVLRQLVQDARNIPGTAAGPESTYRLRDAYVEWVERTEIQLSPLTLDPDVLTMLHTARYWQIRNIDGSTTRPWPLVGAEIGMQSAALERMAGDLDARAARAAAAPGRITVVDTNVLLHYEPPEQIPWTNMIDEPAVRLVVPLRVVEELDEKKYARRGDLADRARRILPKLKQAVGPAGTPGALRDGVTIEIPVDPGPRRRPADADEEILDTCDELSQFAGHPVTLVTGDAGMQLRAEARAIRVVPMPETYARRREQDA